MTSHSRLSPGVEIKEIDRSGYGNTDYSITGTTVFVCGFADRGENYTPQWVNTMSTFERLYGAPKNEVEMYLRTAVKEILDKGGVCVVSKLPYDNASKDRFSVARYEVEDGVVSAGNRYISDMQNVDTSITACLSVSSSGPVSDTITLDTLDGYKTNSMSIARNQILVVDITGGDYGKIDLIDRTRNVTSDDVECLGLMPVITTPVNAMFYQGIISSQTSCLSDGVEVTYGISSYQPLADAQTRDGVLFHAIDGQNFSDTISSSTLADDCVAKAAVECFPQITYNLSSTLDRSYLKKIGLVVFKVVSDPANDNKISFRLVESFVGSLDRLSRDPETGASDYIGDAVNSNSKYVNFFSNVSTAGAYKNAQTIVTAGQSAPVLGFYERERMKHITYVGSVIEPLNLILDRACDPNQMRIDVVADAGVSNIAAFAAQTQDNDASGRSDVDACNADAYPMMPAVSGQPSSWNFELACGFISRWRAVVKKFDDFCRSTRRDCMFVADMFRPVVLDGDEKCVRNTNRTNTIENTVIPRLKYVAGVNSSWSAGYSNWFYSPYGDTGDFFWCPPSIKAVGVYVYTDAYFHAWDAPAGLKRGVVRDVYDVSFNPRNDEAGRIYQQAWNYAVSYPMEGIVIEGQKTFQLNQTALDRVNVRRLMIWLEKRVQVVARRFLYEGNTQYMRQRFVDTIKPIFEEAKTGYGVNDYAIRCDDTLNTSDVIDRNELRCVIAIKPVKTIEWIRIDMICTNQSASVTEEVMK